MKKTILLWLAFLCIITFQKNILAQTTYEAADDGSWNSSSTWDPPGVPGENDIAINPGAFEISITGDVLVSEFHQEGGHLNLAANSSLTILDNGSWENGLITGSSSGTSQLNIPEGVEFTLVEGFTQGKLLDGVELNNMGTITLYEGFAPFGGSVINNWGLFDYAGNVFVGSSTPSDGTFNNYGTILKSIGDGNTNLTAGLSTNNYNGIIDVVEGHLNFTGDIYFQNGQYNIDAGAELLLNGGNYVIEGTLNGASEGEFTVGGSSNLIIPEDSMAILNITNNGTLWAGANIQGGGTLVIPEGAVLKSVYSGSARILSENTTILNQGTFQATIGFAQYDGSPIINEGLFEITDNCVFGSSGSTDGVFENYGTFLKTGGETSTNFATGVTFTNYDSEIDIQVGTIRAHGTWNLLDGLYNLDENTELNFAGTLSLDGTLNGTLDGDFILASADVVVNSEATLDFQGNGVLWSSSDIMGGGILTNAETGLMQIVYGGSGRILTESTTLINKGTMQVTEGIVIENGSVFRNEGMFEITDNCPFTGGGVPEGIFENYGTILKTGGENTTSFGSGLNFFSYDSEIDLQMGKIQTYGDWKLISGTYNLDENTEFIFGGTLHLEGTLSGSAMGDFVLASADVMVDSEATLDFQGNGVQWSSSDIMGGGILTIAETGLMKVVYGGSARILTSTTTLKNKGTIEAEYGIVINDGATLINEGIFDILENTSFSGGGTPEGVFENYGTLLKSGGDGNSNWQGNLDVQNRSGGVIDASMGTLRINTLTNNEGGIIQGNATVYVPSDFVNDGIVSPGTSPGLLNWKIDFEPSATGVLNIELGGLNPGDEHDQLAVNGNAYLNGMLEVNLTDGYIPEEGDSYVILTTTGAVSDTFQTVTVQDELFISVQYNPDNVTLVVDSIGSLSVGEISYIESADGYGLSQNYPNPFSSETKIDVTISGRNKVTLEIYDAYGRLVETLFSQELAAGTYTVEWNASSFPVGYYYCRMQTKDFTKTIKLIRTE